jgi:hypothetical protein
MADPAKYKSLSVKREDWKELGILADKTNRTGELTIEENHTPKELRDKGVI